MNAATRPPLYAYEKAYKGKFTGTYKPSAGRIRRFSDTQYNKLIELASSAVPLNDKHYFAIYSNQPGSLKKLIKDMGILNPANIAVLSGRINLQYPLNKNGANLREQELAKIQKIIAGGPIVSYSPGNPLIAENMAGDTVALTKAENYSNAVYHDENTGNVRVLSEETAKLAEDIQAGVVQQQKTSSTFNYIMASLVVVAVIVIVWAIKKNK